METVALYARTSTELQNTDNQLIVLKKFAESKGWKYDIYEEKESTRKTRPVKAALLSKLRAKEYKTCIIVSLSRWARSSIELLTELTELTGKGINFISINDNLDFNSPTGRFQVAVLSAVATLERDYNRERTLAGLHRVRMAGKILGRPPGSKDKRPRRKSGYILKEASKRKSKDEKDGTYMPLEHYINNK